MTSTTGYGKFHTQSSLHSSKGFIVKALALIATGMVGFYAGFKVGKAFAEQMFFTGQIEE
jgi:hypothetical protein